MKTFITGVALGLLGFSVYASLQRRGRLEHPDGSHPKGEPLQRWEGEGGNVPAANSALKEARTDDLLSPAAQADAVQEPVGSAPGRKPGVSGSSAG